MTIVLKIHGWYPERAYSASDGKSRWYAREFARRLLQNTNLRKPECESLSRRVLRDRICCEIPISKAKDRYGATSIMASFAPATILRAALRVLFVCSCETRNWTLNDEVSRQQINDLWEAIHEIPDLLCRWTSD